MAGDDWDDLRVALAVARTGTVSGAAQVLGLHHATVIRRVDAIEEWLGARLFQRAARGYVPTEAGRVLLEAGGGIEERIAQMRARIGAGDEIEGRLVITALPGLAPRLLPPLSRLLADHPRLRLEYLTDARLFRLDAGEAHIAIRAGTRPTEPDYVVQPWSGARHALFAAPSYLVARGLAEGADLGDLAGHRFVLRPSAGPMAPFERWAESHVPAEARVLVSNDLDLLHDATRHGLGLGFLPEDAAAGLVRVMHRPEWNSDHWLVTHVDLHRSPKVQAALAALKA